jgi:hypothetical protein
MSYAPARTTGYIGFDRLVRLRGGGVGRFRAWKARALAGVAGGQLLATTSPLYHAHNGGSIHCFYLEDIT